MGLFCYIIYMGSHNIPQPVTVIKGLPNFLQYRQSKILNLIIVLSVISVDCFASHYPIMARIDQQFIPPETTMDRHKLNQIILRKATKK